MKKLLQGDLIQATRGIEYEDAKGRVKSVKPRTQGVIVKNLGNGRYWAYFHGHPLIVLRHTLEIRRRQGRRSRK